MKRLLSILFALGVTVTVASATLPATSSFTGTTGNIPTVDETAWAYNRNDANPFIVSATDTTHITHDNTTDGMMHWTGDTFNANHCSEITFAVVSTAAAGSGYGVGVRMDTATTNKIGYRLVGSTQGYELFELNNGVGEGSLSGALGTTTFAKGDTMKLCIVGPVMKMYKNSAQFGITYSDGSLTTGAPGVAHSSNSGATANMGIDVWVGSNAGSKPMVTIFFN